MKQRHWLCKCTTNDIHSWSEQQCYVCKHFRGQNIGGYRKPNLIDKKPKKLTSKEIEELGEIYYELQLELGIGPDKVATELGKNYYDVWYATYKYKQSIGLL